VYVCKIVFVCGIIHLSKCMVTRIFEYQHFNSVFDHMRTSSNMAALFSITSLHQCTSCIPSCNTTRDCTTKFPRQPKFNTKSSKCTLIKFDGTYLSKCAQIFWKLHNVFLHDQANIFNETELVYKVTQITLYNQRECLKYELPLHKRLRLCGYGKVINGW